MIPKGLSDLGYLAHLMKDSPRTVASKCLCRTVLVDVPPMYPTCPSSLGFQQKRV